MYRTAPSELYGIDDPVASWCFDRAVWLFGSHLQSELDRAAESSSNPAFSMIKQQRVLATWLGTKVKYRDPAAQDQRDVTSDGSGSVAL